MRIKLLDIRGFGKFENRRIVPGDGFNLVYGGNESGKSTLAEFIASMLYGLKSGKRVKGLTAGSERSFKPWKAGSFSGVEEYALDDGSLFRIERDFDKGTIHVRDGSAREITGQFALDRDAGPRFAEAHLSLTRTVFEKSALIRQMQSAIDDTGKEDLLEKLANLNTAGNEDLSLKKALDALNSALLEKVGTGRSTTRPLDKTRNRLLELEDRKARIMEQNERYLDTFAALKNKKESLLRLNRILVELKGSRDALTEKRLSSIKAECRELEGRSAKLQAEVKRLEARLGKTSRYEEMTELSLEALNTCLYEYRDTERRLADLSRENERMRENDSGPEVLKADESNKRRGQPKVAGIILWALILVSSAGFAYSVINFNDIGIMPAIAAAAVALGGIAALIASAVRKGRKSGNSNVSILAEPDGEIKGQNDNGVINIPAAAEGENQMPQTGSKMASLEAEKRNLKNKLALYLGIPSLEEWDTDKITSAVESFKAGYREYREDNTKLGMALKELEVCSEKKNLLLREASALIRQDINSTTELMTVTLKAAHDKSGYPESAYESRSGLDNQIRKADEEIKAAELEIRALETKLESVPPLDELAEIDEESTLLRERVTLLENAGKSLTIAGEVMKDVALNMQRNYTPALNKEMSVLVDGITSGRYGSVRTDSSLGLHLEVPESEELMPVNALSGGTIDQVYFAMRLSAIALLERGREIIPVILDEPFAQYDECRAERAMKLLKEASARRQVFFLTCRQRELEIAKSIWGDEMNLITL